MSGIIKICSNIFPSNCELNGTFCSVACQCSRYTCIMQSRIYFRNFLLCLLVFLCIVILSNYDTVIKCKNDP